MNSKDRILVDDWARNHQDISVRLYNALISRITIITFKGGEHILRFQYIDEVTKNAMMDIRNVGISTWNEFEKEQKK